MLIDTGIKKNDIVSGKLVTGEEIVARVSEINEKEIHIVKPLMVTMVQTGMNPGDVAVAPVPWVLTVSDDAVLKINRDKFVFLTKSRVEMVQSYTRATTNLTVPGSGLVGL